MSAFFCMEPEKEAVKSFGNRMKSQRGKGSVVGGVLGRSESGGLRSRDSDDRTAEIGWWWDRGDALSLRRGSIFA